MAGTGGRLVTDAHFDELVAKHRAGWLADAAALCRSLDWHSISDAATVHVLDAAALPPAASETALAWTAAGSEHLLREHLHDRRSGPVLVIAAGRVVRSRLTPATLTADEAYVLGRLEVAQVALHELGHARVAATRGRRLPASATLALLVEAARQSTTDEHWRQSHGRDWCRCYVHLSDRAARSLWPRGWWLDACRHDLRLHGHSNAAAIVEALQPELGSDEPLADILRRDPPAAFTDLFHESTSPTQKATL
jgi:hypothetical protein